MNAKLNTERKHAISGTIAGLIFMFLTAYPSYGFVDDATNSSYIVTGTPGSCPSSGTVTVSDLPQFSGALFFFKLTHTTKSSLSKPSQSSPTFTNVSPGSYVLEINEQYMLDGVQYNNTTSRSVTVSTAYETINLQVATTPTCSNDGTLTVTATNGYLNAGSSYRDAIVSSLTEDEPLTNYVRPKQASNVFSGLSQGTYYVRENDDCLNDATYQTTQATVNSPMMSVSKADILVERLIKDCDSELVTFRTTRTIPDGTLYMLLPDDSQRVLKMNTEIDTIPITAAVFGSGINTVRFEVRYRDASGVETFSEPFSYTKAERQLGFDSKPGSTCYAQDYTFYTLGTDTNWPYTLFSFIGPITYQYSLDGSPLQDYHATSKGDGPTLSLPRDGSTHTVTIIACGTELTTDITTPDNQTPLNLYATENNVNSCLGKSNLTMVTSSEYAVTYHFNSGPSGQSLPADLTTKDIARFPNLLPGTYTFTVSNDCITEDHSFTLSHPLEITYTVVEKLRCDASQSGVDVAVSANYFAESPEIEAVGSSGFNIEITGNATVAIDAIELDWNTNKLTDTVHVALPVGTYQITVTPPQNCTPYQQSITLGGNKPVQLKQLAFTGICTTQLFTVVEAKDGLPPYAFTLYENSIAEANKIAGPQSGNSFVGLELFKTYLVTATDACGTDANIQTEYPKFSFNPVATSLDKTTNDCLGKPAKLEVYNLPGATYQWYKGTTAISGATGSSYSIPSLQSSDLGTYYAELTLGTCSANSTNLALNGTCSTLPVRLTSFNAQKEGNNALLTWSTSFEDQSKQFDIQHSTDALSWVTDGTVAAKGSIATNTSYSYLHRSPVNGTNYYRLKMIDNDESFATSAIRQLQFDFAPLATFYPNPTTDNVRITGTDLSKINRIFVYDLNGRLVLTPTGLTGGLVDLKLLSSGTYIIKVQYKNQLISSHTVRVVK